MSTVDVIVWRGVALAVVCVSVALYVLDEKRDRKSEADFNEAFRKFTERTEQERNAPSVALTPGICQCSHLRSSHFNGTGKCYGQYPPDESVPYRSGTWCQCSCQIYIPRQDRGDDPPPAPDPDPSEKEVNELERIVKL